MPRSLGSRWKHGQSETFLGSHTGSLDDELAEKIREQVVCSEWCRLKVWSRLLQLKVVRPCILSAVKNCLFLGDSVDNDQKVRGKRRCAVGSHIGDAKRIRFAEANATRSMTASSKLHLWDRSTLFNPPHEPWKDQAPKIPLGEMLWSSLVHHQ